MPAHWGIDLRKGFEEFASHFACPCQRVDRTNADPNWKAVSNQTLLAFNGWAGQNL